MAESPAHRFGQIVGELLEAVLKPELKRYCQGRGLYLDHHGIRAGVRTGAKVSWTDNYNNTHDLDFVIEKGGSPSKRGRPVAFIEAAWRRYTKHSRNKAQEIQGAILPIADKYRLESPFLGAVLAGEFTSPSLAQLESVGFNVVYLPYSTVVAAYATVGINTTFDESTPDSSFSRCVSAIDRLAAPEHAKIKSALYAANKGAFDQFFEKLTKKLDRIVERVTVIPLFGSQLSFNSLKDAAQFVDEFNAAIAPSKFQKYELTVHFSNGDKISGTFAEKERAQTFLEHVAV